MGMIGFYCQKRYDGGVRSGIGFDDTTVLQHFEGGGAEVDPALLWYVDLRFEVGQSPLDASEARRFFLENESEIVAALTAAAEHLEVGIDSGDYWPYRYPFKGRDGTPGEITVSGASRLSDGELAEEIQAIAANWRGRLLQMTPLVGV